MSIYKPKGSPFYQYDFRFNGDRYHGTTRKKTKGEAQHVEALERAKIEQFGKDKAVSLDIACGKYFIEVSQGQATESITEYQLERLTKMLGKNTLLHYITAAKLAEYVSTRRGQTSRLNRLPAPATINREIELLRRVVYRARDVWEVKTPTIKWKDIKLREPRERDRMLSEAEEKKLLAEAAPHLRPAIEFSLLTGIRLDNCIKLDWKQIDIKGQEITFVVKGDKLLVFPIYSELLVFLANRGPQDEGLLFTHQGKPIKTWKTAWSGAKKRAGITDFRWHDLRHTVASRWVAKGMDISMVQELLGHSNITTTQRYIHHQKDTKLAALEAVDSRNIPEVKTIEATK